MWFYNTIQRPEKETRIRLIFITITMHISEEISAYIVYWSTKVSDTPVSEER